MNLERKSPKSTNNSEEINRKESLREKAQRLGRRSFPYLAALTMFLGVSKSSESQNTLPQKDSIESNTKKFKYTAPNGRDFRYFNSMEKLEKLANAINDTNYKDRVVIVEEAYPKHTGSTTGSGETFRAEIPYKDGIRLFKGVEGEQQYKEWLSKFEKSGGKVGKLDLNNSESKNSSNQEEIAEKKSSDSSFYQEVKTREGTRVFRGEDGKREYQKWQQKLNNSRR